VTNTSPAEGVSDSCEQSLTSTPLVVLDTNAVLDWLLFADPSMRALADAIQARRVRWIVTQAMWRELEQVLLRDWALARGAGLAAPMATWEQHAVTCPVAAAAPWRCTDPDDQKFLDLAVAGGARWLVSRDRALLKLRRRSAMAGLRITPPSGWSPP
jgi:uncharacterized protein